MQQTLENPLLQSQKFSQTLNERSLSLKTKPIEPSDVLLDLMETKLVEVRKELDYELGRHDYDVSSVSISSDSSFIVSGSRDSTVKVWILNPKLSNYKLQGHTNWVNSVAISPDDKLIASASSDKSIKVWSVLEQSELYTLNGHSTSVNSICFTPDGDFIISASGSPDVPLDKSIIIWSTHTRSIEFVLSGHSEYINTVTISSNGKFIVSGSADKTIKCWDFINKSEFTLLGHTEQIFSVAVSPDNKLIASGSDDRKVKLWSYLEKTEIVTLNLHIGPVYTVTFSPNTKYLLSGSRDQKITAYNLRLKKIEFNLTGHSSYVNSISASPNNKFIVSASKDQSLIIWDFQKPRDLFTIDVSFDRSTVFFTEDSKSLIITSEFTKSFDLETKSEEVLCNKYSEMARLTNDGILFSVSGKCKVSRWDLAEKRKIESLDIEDCQIGAIASTPNGQILAGVYGFKYYEEYDENIDDPSLDYRSVVSLWDLRDDSVFSLDTEKGVLRTVDLSIDGKIVVFGSSDKEVGVWYWPDESSYFKFLGHSDMVQSVRITSNNKFVVSGSIDKLVKVWNLQDRRVEFTLTGHSDKVNSVDVSYDLKYVVSGSSDYKVKVWGFESRCLEFNLDVYSGEVVSVAISKDSSYIACGLNGDTVKLWNFQDKSADFTFRPHKLSVNNVLISPDLNYLITSSESGIIKILNFHDLSLKTILTKRNYDVAQLVLSHDGQYLVAGLQMGVFLVWSLNTFARLFSIKAHEYSINSVSISTDNTLIATGCADNSIKLWNFSTKTEKTTFLDHKSSISSVIFTFDNQYLISGSGDNNIIVWSIQNNCQYFCLTGHLKAISSLAVTRDNKFIVSGSYDATIRVWSFAGRREEFCFTGFKVSVNSVNISSDGNFIISSGDDCVKIWNIEEKKEELTLNSYTSQVNCANFSPDTKYAICGCGRMVRGSGGSGSESDDENPFEEDSNFGEELNLNLENEAGGGEGFEQYGECGGGGGGGGEEEDCEYIEKLQPKRKYKTKTNLKNPLKIWNIQERLGDYNKDKNSDLKKPYTLSSDGKYKIFISPEKLYLYNVKTNKEIIDFCILSINSKNLSLYAENALIEFVFTSSANISALWQELSTLSATNPQALKLISSIIYINSTALAPQSTHDPYFQPRIPYKNFIQCLQRNEFTSLSQSALNLYFSVYKYTTPHILAYKGYSIHLKKVLIPSTLINTDIFGKSPIFYSIQKKHQSCTNIILEFLISLESSANKESSFYALRNDFFLIIQNSSKYLPELLDNIMISTSIFMIPEDSLHPNFILTPFSKPKLIDYQIGSSHREMPAIFKLSALKFYSTPFSEDNIKSLQSIQSCLNDRIYESLLIKSYIDYNWKAISTYAGIYSILLILNIVTFVYTLQYKEFNLGSMIVFLVAYLFVFFWEAIQIFTSGAEYFKDPWNLIDFFTFFTIIYWATSAYFGIGTEYEKFLLAFLLMSRGLTAFRIIEGTRYYVQLIISSINSIRYFLIMFCYSTMFFSVLFTISKGEELSLSSMWDESWQLNFGEHVSLEGAENYALTYISVFAATIVNVVLMLNLLISILGDSYDNFLLQKNVIDYREKLSVSLEFQRGLFFKRTKGEELYLQVLTSPLDDENGSDDWQGRILYMEKRQERKIDGLGQSISEQIKEYQKKVVGNSEIIDAKVGGLESKIVEIVESRINEVENRISEKLEKMEANLQDLIKSIKKE